LEKLGLNLGYIVVQILAFLLLFVVLRAWVYKPLITMLDKRREKIAAGLEDARVAGEARAHAEKEAEKITTEAQAKAAHIISEATERADASMLEVRAQADNDIAKEREATLVEVEEERNRMLGDLRGQVATLAIAASQKLIGQSLDENHQHALLEEFFSGVRSGKVAGLEDHDLSGGPAEVISALPLTADEQATVKREILGKLGEQTQVDFKVDPTILGGLIVRVGDKVLDNSVGGKLDELKQSLR
jgi:F-type H+-transporting ATPase subunit b